MPSPRQGLQGLPYSSRHPPHRRSILSAQRPQRKPKEEAREKRSSGQSQSSCSLWHFTVSYYNNLAQRTQWVGLRNSLVAEACRWIRRGGKGSATSRFGKKCRRTADRHERCGLDAGFGSGAAANMAVFTSSVIMCCVMATASRFTNRRAQVQIAPSAIPLMSCALPGVL